MRRSSRTLLLAAALTLTASSAWTHHSVSGQFDTSKRLTLTGVITKIDWQNPHIYIFLDGKDDAGVAGQWALETLPTAMMRRANLTKDDVAGKSGDIVTITANPARDGRKNAWILRITYPDGHYYQLAGS